MINIKELKSLLIATIILATLPSGLGAQDTLFISDGSIFEKKDFYPGFSWNISPQYFMFGNSTTLTTEEVNVIAEKANFICIEKNHGRVDFGYAELGAKHEIAEFKAKKPGIKALYYFNSAYAWPFTSYNENFTWDKIENYPELKAFLIVNQESGELEHRNNVFFFDVLSPEFREWWVETVVDGVEVSGADGVFIDQMHGFVWLRPEKTSEVEAAQGALMADLKLKMGADKILLANNAAGVEEVFPSADAFMFEHYNEVVMTKERLLQDWDDMLRIAKAGKMSIYRFGMDGEDKPDTAAELEKLSKERIDFYLACYLIGAQPYSYFQYGWGFQLSMGALVDYPTLRKPLGAPLGAYVRASADKWEFTREFEHASVWVDTEKREGKITWDVDSMIAVLDAGNTWYHNYSPEEFYTPVIVTNSGSLSTFEANPSDTLNPSPLVSKFTRDAGPESYIKFGLPGEIADISKGIFKVRVYVPSLHSAGNNTLQLVLRKDDLESTQLALSREITELDKWVEYTFDMSEDTLKEAYYNDLYLFFASPDGDNASEGNVYFIDAFQGPENVVNVPLHVTFSIYSDITGSILSNIPVILGEKEVQTGLNGAAIFELFKGNYEYSISHPDYFTTASAIDLSRDTTIKIILVANKAGIKFRIYSEDKPLYNVALDLDGSSLNTNQTGIAFFQDLARFEEHYWTASKVGYEEVAGTVSLENDTTVNLSMTLLSSFDAYESQGLTFYPNPVRSSLFIESSETISRIEICDLRAAVIKLREVNDNKATFDMSGYPDGVYIANIYRDGLRTVSLKVLKSE